MPFDKTVETCRGNRGQTEEHSEAPQQRPEFVLQPWILVAKDEDHDQDSGKTERDRETGSEDDQVDGGQGSHRFSFRNGIIKLFDIADYDECALDQRAQDI